MTYFVFSYLLGLAFCFKLAFDDEEGMFILIGLILFLNFFVSVLFIFVEFNNKLIKWIKYGKDRNKWS